MTRRRKGRKVGPTEWKDEFGRLPEELLLNILSRLPTKALLTYRRVCKSWRSSITRDAYFLNTIHLNGWVKNSTPSLLVWFSSGDCPSLQEVVLGAVGQEVEVEVTSLPSNSLTSFGSSARSVAMVSSVNGLVCFSPRFQDGSYERYVYVCNPITRETMAAPYSASSSRELGPCGFVFSTSIQRYKLFRIFTTDERTSPYEEQRCEVLILGTKSWRDLGPLPISVKNKKVAALASGSLHWLASNSLVILSIDIESENMKILQSPRPRLEEAWVDDPVLAEIRGYLSVVHYHSQDLDIWMLKDNIWSRNYRIPCYDLVGMMIPIAVQGTVIILKSRDKLVCYNSEKGVLAILSLGMRQLDDVLPFTGSLVSLASIGEWALWL